MELAVAAQDVLRLLLDRVGLDLWLVTRVSGDVQTVLASSSDNPAPGPDGVGDPSAASSRPSTVTPPAPDDDGGASWAPTGRVQAGTALAWQSSPCRLMVQRQVPLAVPRTAQLAELARTIRDLGLPTGSYVGVPLLHANGALFGTLCGFGRTERTDLAAELPLVEALGRLLSTVTSREQELAAVRRESDLLRALADHDPLTGLLNRRGWDAALAVEQERTRRTSTAAAIVTLDLDGLKRLNDTGGHDTGDRALLAVADALRATGRRGDPLARVGGDEFTLLAVGLADPVEATRLADRVRRACAQRGVSVSAGIAAGRSGQALTQVWQAADADMYAARAARRPPGGDSPTS